MHTDRDMNHFSSMLNLASDMMARGDFGPTMDALVKQAMVDAHRMPTLLENAAYGSRFNIVVDRWTEIRGSQATTWISGTFQNGAPRFFPMPEGYADGEFAPDPDLLALLSRELAEAVLSMQAEGGSIPFAQARRVLRCLGD